MMGNIQVVEVQAAGSRAVRMMRSDRVADRSILDTHYLVGSDFEIAHFTERHELGLFDQDQYVAAFESAQLRLSIDPAGLTGRGLIVAVRLVAIGCPIPPGRGHLFVRQGQDRKNSQPSCQTNSFEAKS